MRQLHSWAAYFPAACWLLREYRLSPFKATYQSEWDVGFSLSGEAVRKLAQLDNGWQLSLKASALAASIDESSKLYFSPQGVRPEAYRYQRKVFGKKRSAALDFDWNNNSVSNSVNDQPWQMEIPTGTLDKLSYQLQLRIDLIEDKTPLQYQVADGGRLKDYKFVREGQETVNTPAGEYQAVKVRRDRGPDSNRETWLWFAPELNYQLVKLLQTEKDGKSYSLVLKQLN